MNILAKKNANVKVTIYTLEKTKLSQEDINNFSGQFNHVVKVDIESVKVDIESVKVDIETKLPANVSEKTINHVVSLYLKCGKNEIFGRTVVEETTRLKSSFKGICAINP